MSTGQEQVIIGLAGLFFVALLYSFFALSVIMFCFGILALFEIELQPFRWRWRGTFPQDLAHFLDQSWWWLMTMPFLIVLFGAFYSEDSAYWLTRMRIKVPFLLFPMAFFLIPTISRRAYRQIHFVFVVIMSLSTLPVIWQMLLEYEQILLRLQQGQPIDTPVSHIRYSLLIALAALSSMLLWYKDYFPPKTNGSRLLLVLGLALGIFLHFLAVRSGIVAFYLGGLVLWMKLSWTNGFSPMTRLLLLAFVTLPFAAYFIIPSFQNKAQYMWEDLNKYRARNWNAYSDSERILSIQAGMAIAKENALVGIGPGDLPIAMQNYFYQHYDKDSFILPHNQFVTVAAGSGFIGLLLFVVFLIIPLWAHGHYKNDFLLTIYVVVGLSLLVENTFETSVGVAIFIFFSCLGLNAINRESEHQ